ncbi:beta-ketoacyl-ACP synthase III [Rickettsiales endosymbiont of Stachyamoeba lipophora]|uniref:beta-ketoacyl-ACP synthase III n=1 Tax=Rickettsiales endosymbiont of Stachyamoeba lipophora TaxID=2486578 RepID=UPI000F64EE37|nr:beta-ketoacyl-ACP synthase III [Rickettsiales endosymbiont of Stachyamoeba lipophora]AZL16148.1 ketoacyl-ACP synthase III [Rickettsiales endosymbiont of Stachyamoeba lipophora]
MNSEYIAIVKATGSYLPPNLVSNNKLTERVNTSDEWISSRTGIKQRYFVNEDQATSDLATMAAQEALNKANLDPSAIDLIIVATTTPDYTFPSTAVIVQSKLKAVNAFAFDVQAVCAGFLYALETANNYIATGRVKNALVIGAETMSRVVNWNDRTTCVLFGDGAGCFLLEASNNREQGIKKVNLFSNGDYLNILCSDNGPGTTNQASYLTMKGVEVYKHAVDKMSRAVEGVLASANMSVNDLDWLIPHQANIRIINAVGERLKIDPDKTIITVDQHANTSAASIPLAFDHALKHKLISRGNKIAFTAIGGGLAWGAGLMIY